MANMFEKYYSKEELSYLKASEARELKKTEDALIVVLIGILVLAFVAFISSVALVLWFSKLTIFISIIVSVPLSILCFLYYKGVLHYRKNIEKVRDRIKSQEKQTL